MNKINNSTSSVPYAELTEVIGDGNEVQQRSLMLCFSTPPASTYACIMHSHAQKPETVQNQLKHVIGYMQ